MSGSRDQVADRAVRDGAVPALPGDGIETVTDASGGSAVVGRGGAGEGRITLVPLGTTAGAPVCDGDVCAF